MNLESQANQLAQWIKEYDRIIIHRHVRPDPDAIGSQLGLKTMILEQYPQKTVLAAGTSTASLDWLGTMDRVTAEDYQGALVIIVDTANTDRIDGSHYNKGARWVKIDHHIEVEPYGDLMMVDPDQSSTSELLCQLFPHLNLGSQFSPEAARLLYAGIVGDTGRFQHNSTHASTFRAVAELFDTGMDFFAVNNWFIEASWEEMKFQSWAIDHLEQLEPGLALLRISQDAIKQANITEEDTNSITNLPARLKGILSWVILVEQENKANYYRVRLRSKGPAVDKIANQFNGGGHAMASGAYADGEEEVQSLIQAMQALNQDYLASK